MNRIILIGYRACGKTSVAKILGQRLGWTVYDSDVLVEKHSGKSIAALFSEEGEPAFRDLEAKAIASLLAQNEPLILATGGGAPLHPATRREFKRGGIVVWLKASAETILARMNADASNHSRRPQLTDLKPLEEIKTLLEERSPIYSRTATLALDTETKTPDELAREILTVLDSF